MLFHRYHIFLFIFQCICCDENNPEYINNIFFNLTFSAPNIYSMPPVLGEAKEGSKRAAPAFSITGRGKTIESKTPMPGPGTYTTEKAAAVITKRPPAYTMAPRREVKQASASVPGPDVYCPEKVIYTRTFLGFCNIFTSTFFSGLLKANSVFKSWFITLLSSLLL